MRSRRNWWTSRQRTALGERHDSRSLCRFASRAGSSRTIAVNASSHRPTRNSCNHRMAFRTNLSFTATGFCFLPNAALEGMDMKIFIADDSGLVVERLVGLLDEVPGARLVGQAGDVVTAVNGIHSAKPDAVILDLHMPGGTGLDVLRAIRADYPDLYVLICTNFPYPEYRDE